MRMANTTMLTKEEMEINKCEIHEFLFEQFAEEITDSEEYMDFYYLAESLGDNQMASLFLSLSKTEVEHAEQILNLIKKEFPTLEREILYPLMKHKVECLHGIKEKLNTMR